MEEVPATHGGGARYHWCIWRYLGLLTKQCKMTQNGGFYHKFVKNDTFLHFLQKIDGCQPVGM